MGTICLNVKDSYLETVLNFVKLLPKDVVEIYEEDSIATEEDKKVYEEAVEDLKNGKTVSLEAYINKRALSV